MMVGYLGLNVRGGGLSNDNVAAFVHQLQPRATLVINESKLAAMLVGSVPRTIFRMKGNAGIIDDDMAFEKHNPILFADALHALAPVGCWLYGGNEFGSEQLDRQNDWTLRFVERCAQLGRKPLVHNNAMQHPSSGVAGWNKLKSSSEAARQAGGGVGPHIYYYPTIATEYQRRPRHSFMVLDELRQVFGADLSIVISEFGYAEGYDPHKGYQGFLPEEDYALEHERLAEIARQYDADMLTFGVFEPQTEWQSFNIWDDDTWLKPHIVAVNQRIPVVSGGDMVLVRKPGVTYALNIRSAPILADNIVGSVAPTEQVILLEANVTQGWVKIRKSATVGFVSLQTNLAFGSQVKVTAAA
jgi:hypothetical protein